jgi:hypothetical protein
MIINAWLIIRIINQGKVAEKENVGFLGGRGKD